MFFNSVTTNTRLLHQEQPGIDYKEKIKIESCKRNEHVAVMQCIIQAETEK